MTEEKITKEAVIHQTADWINEQIQHVWRAVIDEEAPKPKDGELQIRRAQKDTFYKFVYKGQLVAEARSYFNDEEKKWMFELIQVAQEYYPKVREYFARLMSND